MKAVLTLGVGLAVVLALALVPVIGPRILVQDLFKVLCLLVLALNWNLLAGFAGLVSVGQQAFVGIGAYVMFATTILWGWDPLAGMLIGGMLAMALSIPIAFFAFRLNGAYFAIGTWAVADIARLSFGQWRALGGGTGTALPRDATREMFGVGLVRDLLGVSPAAAIDAVTYWLALGLATVMLVACWLFLRSRMGLGLQAVRDNPVAAQSVGVDPTRLKALVFLLTAFVTGLCGALLFIQIGRITPDAAFSVIDWTAFVIFIVVIGGIGTLPGPIVGVLVFYGLQRLLSDYGTVYLIALGLIGIAIMLFARRGLWGGLIHCIGFDPFPLGHAAPRLARQSIKEDAA
ncbi:branched-chain amino acid ABC transporter permease [Pseudotabrizicola sediminis]|uniref:Branched-chain amino acid ABC transporter permease n=1 Tax=Pseudotabrizicola sediminis TaxID=2486418 RepID=A0ABY2KMM2_9RHOB|nr:branched-chain amino acid ABC transporter permease [Pseudotabrizicola sediminis]TGD42598.1 branched-chain amino acid ABC transporter permease [Pseudotabrizicola sediminis]